MAMTVRYAPNWVATSAVAGRTSGQPGPWDPLPDSVFEALEPEVRQRFARECRTSGCPLPCAAVA